MQGGDGHANQGRAICNPGVASVAADRGTPRIRVDPSPGDIPKSGTKPAEGFPTRIRPKSGPEARARSRANKLEHLQTTSGVLQGL